MKRLVYIAPLVMFLGLAAYFFGGLQRDPRAIPSVLIDTPIPEFDLPPIQEYTDGFASTDTIGEVSLVNVFGAWCIACQVEHPFLMKLAREGDVPINAIDWNDPPGAGAAWLKRRGDPYTRIGDDPKGRTVIDFGVTGAPETFVIDAKGRIRYRHVGVMTQRIWDTKIRPMIDELRAAP